MEESPSPSVLDGIVTGIRFGLATFQEICTSSISDCPINHASQLSNPFLGLPLESGKCESCGSGEPGECEGHFGYIELPIPVYHPSHINELKRMLSLLCLKCLKIKTMKTKNTGMVERVFSCCEEASQISISEAKTTDGAYYLELKVPSRSRIQDGFWNFLDRYGFRYGDGFRRPLLPSEVLVMLKKIPQETRRKLAGKGYFHQDGYILHYLPVPPNCLSVPDVSDGKNFKSSDLSVGMLKKVLKQVDIIKSSRSGTPNFESHEVEANDLQTAVGQYLEVRGTAKSSRDVDTRFGIRKETSGSSTKSWLEKMKTLFIRKGSGFSSRSVITGDSYKRVDEIGLPFEIAQRITFEERVNQHNMNFLQKLVDEKLCLTYKDGSSTYSLREGSTGHTFLRPGQVVHRRIMDGDTVFINRPPTTHKHSLQALTVYVHEDHTVKINPLICGPLSADFDGDCVHLFYPQSLAAKAEVLELFSVEKQLLSSHNGNLNLQMTTDSLLSFKMMFKNFFLNRAAAQQLAMFVSNSLPTPASLKVHSAGPLWTALQILQIALPVCFDCCGEKYLIRKSEILEIDFNKDILQSVVNDIITSIFFDKGPNEVLMFFNSIQPLLMENLFSEGFSVGLEDFYISRAVIDGIQKDIQDSSPLLFHLRSIYNELVELQLEKCLRGIKIPVTKFIIRSSAMGTLIDCKSESAINKIVQQIGFLGLQLSDKGKLYSGTLVGDIASLFKNKYPSGDDYPAEEFGLIRSCLIHGLDPYQGMVHSISSREVMVRSSRGLTEPGTLFKNLMAILRDVVICYDGTVRNVCSNSVIQFEYGAKDKTKPRTVFAAGEPVGVLAATAMSNPAYKAVLDSSSSSNSSWEMMKEILLCGVNFKNVLIDRRVILYLNDCACGRKYCRENAAYLVKNQLKKVSLKDTAVEFLIEYGRQQTANGSSETDAGLVGHIHLNKIQLKDLNLSMTEVLEKCQETINSFGKKRKIGHLFKRIILSVSECCCFQQSRESKWLDMPCVTFFCQDMSDHELEIISHILADTVCPALLETTIKGDPRVSTANIIWITPDTTTWIRNPCNSQRGELALDVILEKDAVKQSGDAWRIVLDACLPVFHLIDTQRSIPYAIKQVQEMLGVSCAFEQAVQRLSTSVTMVTKGVLKDHLILLANSMTCAGNLIGFNMGGIKALSRSLNVQVPFTEATLFTPRKCFERAAEKCHVDSLSSIVASCSWGKRVAVGTGSTFDVLWGTREVGLNEEKETDVYDFLHLVRGSSNREQLNNGCLGADIDTLDSEGENTEMCPSPEHPDKPTFEDSMDFEGDINNNNLDSGEPSESKWENAQSVKVDAKGSGEWVVEKKSDPKPGAWSNWGSEANKSTTGGWNGTESAKEYNQPGSSSERKIDEGGATWNKKDGVPLEQQSGSVSAGAGAWDTKADGNSSKSGGWTKADGNSSKSGGWTKADGNSSKSGGWTKADGNSSKSGGWNAMESAEGGGQSGSWSSSKKVDEAEETGWSKKGSHIESVPAWGKKVEDVDKNLWGKTDAHLESGMGRNNSGSWGAAREKKADETPWNRKGGESPVERSSGLVTSTAGVSVENAQEDSSRSSGWNAVESKTKPDQLGSWSSWGKKDNQTNGEGSKYEGQSAVERHAGAWNVDRPQKFDKQLSAKDLDGQVNESKTSADWSSSKSASWGKVGSQSDSGQHKESEWDLSKKATDDLSNQPATKSEWDSPIIGSRSGSDVQSSWGQNKHFSGKRDNSENPRGWGSSAGDWKNKRNRPAKLGGVNDDSNACPAFTATRQRLDMFTSEEQDVLLDVEPIMKSIRKIMHQTGYNDGDPLSADDQTFILDNVLNYHPDKAVKIGAGIDHVTVNKHSKHQDSRCFYVVSTDGNREDFSYLKCLENFIKGKYPEKAEAFNGKYFRRPRNPNPGGNRERSLAPEDAGRENNTQ